MSHVPQDWMTDDGSIPDTEKAPQSQHRRNALKPRKPRNHAKPRPRHTTSRGAWKAVTHHADDTDSGILMNALEGVTWFMVDVFMRIIKRAFNLLIPLLALCFAALIVFWAAYYMAASQIAWTHSKVCSVAFLQRTPLCPSIVAQTTAYPELVATQHKIGDVIDTVGYPSRLAGNMRRAQVIIENLIPAVEVSNLTYRDELAVALTKVAKHAEQVGNQLYKLDSAMIGTINDFVVVNNMTIKDLQKIQAAEKSRSIIYQLLPSQFYDRRFLNVLTKRFNTNLENFQSDVVDLIGKMDAASLALNTLKDRLQDLRKLMIQQREDIPDLSDHIIADILGYVMGQSSERKQIRKNLKILANVEEWQGQAMSKVGTSLKRLHEINADFQDMNRKSGRYFVAEEAEDQGSQLETNIGLLESGTQKLIQWQERAERTHQAVIDQNFDGKSAYMELH